MSQDECKHTSGVYVEDGVERCKGCKNSMSLITALENIERLKSVDTPCEEKVSGVYLIAKERQRQIDVEGWDIGHDDIHTEEQMAMAAACYATSEQLYAKCCSKTTIAFVDPWPWDAKWDKRKDTTRIRDLTKAGALIAAEIDRLQRKEENEEAFKKLYIATLKEECKPKAYCSICGQEMEFEEGVTRCGSPDCVEHERQYGMGT